METVRFVGFSQTQDVNYNCIQSGIRNQKLGIRWMWCEKIIFKYSIVLNVKYPPYTQKQNYTALTQKPVSCWASFLAPNTFNPVVCSCFNFTMLCYLICEASRWRKRARTWVGNFLCARFLRGAASFRFLVSGLKVNARFKHCCSYPGWLPFYTKTQRHKVSQRSNIW